MEERKNTVDSDLFEQLDEEEMSKLVHDAQEEAIRKAALEKEAEKPVRRFPRWLFWMISVIFLFSTFSFIFQTYSIPAIEFLTASARLSANENIQSYKKSVVTIAAGDSKGTGFSISSNGFMLTNYHVIEGNEQVQVDFPEEGVYMADVVDTYEEIDLALLKVKGENLPFLKLAEQPAYMSKNDMITFIGNPLRFHGIVNEGTIVDSILLNDWEEEVIVIKAPVYRGNSGSPVIDDNGQVIGVVFATMKHDVYGKVGLAVPIELYQEAKQ
ncbi:serine protease [Siminovitchia sp. FSL H7-0308]|uniref:S1C family serine protease n=1 Tax=unclassified Siminovitchia TaxID=2837530 RepID=UPI0030D4406C